MKIVSVITARGGSKGIPRKNIVDINGKPLIWYSINASLKSNVDETWVSTEDKEIKKISLQCGAQVIDRPIELADDIIMPDEALVCYFLRFNFRNKSLKLNIDSHYECPCTSYTANATF